MYTVSKKNVRYSTFCNLKELEPIFIIFGTKYPNNPIWKHL